MLSDRHLRGLELRGLDPELAIRLGTFSGRRCDDGETVVDAAGKTIKAKGGELVPDLDGEFLCFPYFEGERLIQVKGRSRRDGEKFFIQQPDCEKTFYNANVLLNDEYMGDMTPKMAPMSLCIVEGEPDCQAALMAGYYTTVSVPNGAPPARDKHGRLIEVPKDTGDIEDLSQDVAFSYLWRFQEQLQAISHFVIATDDDEAGRRLAKELIRRLGAARCSQLQYPKDPVVVDRKTGEIRAVKDLDEVRQHFGLEKVEELIRGAKAVPVEGLFQIDDYPDQDELEILPCHITPEFDEHFRLYPSAFVPVTGLPNLGKSEIVKQIAVNMGIHYGWHTAIFPGEEMIKPFLAESLKTKFLKKPKKLWTPEENETADEFLHRHFSIIGADPRFEDDYELTVEKVLDLAATSVFRHGTRMLIIDPWNELDHERDNRVSLTEYVGKMIRKIKKFAKYYGCVVIVVAHPKKVEGQPTLYDISDSAHWYNKADLAIIVDTEDQLGTLRDAIIAKVRFNGVTGKKGLVPLDFDVATRMFVRPADLHRAAA